MTDNDTMVTVTQADYALAETVVHASNIVSHDGYYEVDIDRAAQAIARHQSGRTGAGEALRDQWGNSADDPFEAACLGAPITAIQSEVDRWIEAHRISFDQAMSNGAEAMRLREALEAVQFACANHGGDCERDPQAVISEIHAIVTAALGADQ